MDSQVKTIEEINNEIKNIKNRASEIRNKIVIASNEHKCTINELESQKEKVLNSYNKNLAELIDCKNGEPRHVILGSFSFISAIAFFGAATLVNPIVFRLFSGISLCFVVHHAKWIVGCIKKSRQIKKDMKSLYFLVLEQMLKISRANCDFERELHPLKQELKVLSKRFGALNKQKEELLFKLTGTKSDANKDDSKDALCFGIPQITF